MTDQRNFYKHVDVHHPFVCRGNLFKLYLTDERPQLTGLPVWATKKEGLGDAQEPTTLSPEERERLEDFCQNLMFQRYKLPYEWKYFGVKGYKALYMVNSKKPKLDRTISYQQALHLYAVYTDVLVKADAEQDVWRTVATQTPGSAASVLNEIEDTKVTLD